MQYVKSVVSFEQGKHKAVFWNYKQKSEIIDEMHKIRVEMHKRVKNV